MNFLINTNLALNSSLLASSVSRSHMGSALEGFPSYDGVAGWDPNQSRYLGATSRDDHTGECDAYSNSNWSAESEVLHYWLHEVRDPVQSPADLVLITRDSYDAKEYLRIFGVGGLVVLMQIASWVLDIPSDPKEWMMVQGALVLINVVNFAVHFRAKPLPQSQFDKLKEEVYEISEIVLDAAFFKRSLEQESFSPASQDRMFGELRDRVSALESHQRNLEQNFRGLAQLSSLDSKMAEAITYFELFIARYEATQAERESVGEGFYRRYGAHQVRVAKVDEESGSDVAEQDGESASDEKKRRRS